MADTQLEDFYQNFYQDALTGFQIDKDASKDYVATKPIHESQRQYQGEEEQRLRSQYQKCEGGSFFSIDCVKKIFGFWKLIRSKILVSFIV